MGTLDLLEKAMQIHACVHACLYHVLISCKWCSMRLPAPCGEVPRALRQPQVWACRPGRLGVRLRLPGTTFLFPPQTEGNVKGWWAEDRAPSIHVFYYAAGGSSILRARR